ncbi:helix-turn-helix transcriptional regulator [Enterococcus faecium]|nr:helix-turn-helix transcriptional regulator [Enterococcus faecium]
MRRRCQEVFGKSPMQVFHQIKCQEARKRLEETNLSIHEIASDLGFTNASRFSETFQRFEGVSPIKVRKQQKL